MALIKCSGCGAEISEKALRCPKCGKENHLIQEVKKKENRRIQKQVVLGIIMFVVLAAVVFAVIIGVKKFSSNNDDYLYGLKWGTDVESAFKKIQKVYSKAELLEQFEIDEEARGVVGVVKDFEGRKDVSCRVVLECKNNDTLTGVDQVYMIGKSSMYTTDKLEKELYDNLEKKYGKPVNDKYGYEWDTTNSKIFLITADDETVVLSYGQLDW